MPAPPSDDAADLREWAVGCYGGDARVRSVCHALQDQHGVDVVALLALWWACAHGRHTHPDVAGWVTSTRTWTDDVVIPLRRARRSIEPGRLRDQVAEAEVAAELHQLDQLAATAPPPGAAPATTSEWIERALAVLVRSGDLESARVLLSALDRA